MHNPRTSSCTQDFTSIRYSTWNISEMFAYFRFQLWRSKYRYNWNHSVNRYGKSSLFYTWVGLGWINAVAVEQNLSVFLLIPGFNFGGLSATAPVAATTPSTGKNCVGRIWDLKWLAKHSKMKFPSGFAFLMVLKIYYQTRLCNSWCGNVRLQETTSCHAKYW